MSRPVCKFFGTAQGCRNGAACRFEHPNTNSNPFGSNRFSSLSSGNTPSNDQTNAYKITPTAIQVDLAQERPTWILSCYGPGKEAPEQLFGGYPREQSLEEVRLHVLGSANQQQAMSEVQALYQQAEQQMQTTLGDLNGAVQFLLSAENNHPNRHDICKQNGIQGNTPGTFSRDAVQNSTSSPFGATNAFSTPSQSANPFSTGASSGTSAFGQPSQPGSTGSAFGQPSALGQKPNPFGAASSSSTSAFGQPSQIGASGSAFGQPSQPGSTGSAFGQPSQLGSTGSAFGQPSQPGSTGSAFGQPSQLGSTGSAFGQPSQLGSAGSAFGKPSALGSGGPAFGQTSSLGQKPNPFGAASTSTTSPFGQAAQAQSNPTPSAFGQPSALGQKPNPFGAPATTSSPSPFGQAAAAPAAANPFGQTSSTPASNDQSMDTSGPASGTSAPSNPFGQATTTTASAPSPFGTTSNTTNAFANSSPFAAASNPSAGSSAPNPFGRPPAPQQPAAVAMQAAKAPGNNNPYPSTSTKQHPLLESYLQRAPNGRQIASFRGQPVVYRFKGEERYLERPPDGQSIAAYPPIAGIKKPDGTWTRIIFPDGPPGYNPDTEAEDPAQYQPAVKQAYEVAERTGRFEGDMPEVPPMREDCIWAF